VIAEAPSSRGGVLPLADFVSVAFEEARANGSLLSGSMPGIEPITMVSGSAPKAAPSAIGAGAFSDRWVSQ
jgi:hypothetical protein